MALPSGITPKTVTVGIASFFDGTLASGQATITAPVNVIHTPTNRPIFSSQMSKPFIDGVTSFNLCPTDAAGLNRVDWTYKLSVTIPGAIVQPEPVWFTLPQAGPNEVDLDSLVTVPSSAGVPVSVSVPTLSGPNAWTGTQDFTGATVTGIAGGVGGSTDPEIVRDTIAAALVAGSGVTITPNDAGNSITIAATGGTATDVEVVRDTIATALVAGSGVTITPNDGADTITIAATGGAAYTDEQAQDAAAAMIVAGTHTGVTVAYNDAGGALNLTATGVAAADATTTAKGVVLLATGAKAIAGTDAASAITPVALKAATDAANFVTAADPGVRLVIDPVPTYTPAEGEVVLSDVADGLPPGDASNLGDVLTFIGPNAYDYQLLPQTGGGSGGGISLDSASDPIPPATLPGFIIRPGGVA